MARNDETITLRIEGEDAGFIRVTEQVANQLRQMEGEAKDLQAELDKMERQDRLVSQFRELNRVTQSLEGNFDQTRAALIQTRREMGRGANATAEQAQNLARVEREHRNARAALRTHERALQNVRREAARYNTTLDVTDDQLANVRREQQRLNAELARSRGAYRDLAGSQRRVNDNNTDGARRADAMTRAFKRLSQAYIAFMLASHAASGVKDQIDEFGELEAALIGVQKTAEGMTQNELADMGDEIKRLATEITPTAATELAKFAQAAGQMGVQGQDALIAYVKLADQLAIATDLTGDAAVTALTRIVKLSTSTQDEISNLGASLVALGNTSSVTESELLHFANDVMTRIGSTANVSGDEVLGLAASLAELGIQPERASTSLQKLFAFIVDAVNNGGDAMKVFQDITGETADVLRNEFAESGTKSFQRLVEGFVTAQKSGQGFKVRLAQMGETGTIVNGVVNTLVGSFDRMSERIKFSGEEAVKNTAHINEASKFYASQNSEIGRLVNKYKKLQAAIGETWSYETQSVIDAATTLITDQKGQLLDVADASAELGGAFVVLFDRVFDFGGESTQTFKALEGVLVVFKTLLEGLGSAANGVAYTLNKAFLNILKVSEFIGNDVGKQIADTEQRMQNLADEMEASTKRIATDWAVVANSTSYSYEKLKNAADKYSGSIKNLSEEDQKLLDKFLKSGKSIDHRKDGYRRLVATLINLDREEKVAKAQVDESTISTDKNTTSVDKNTKAKENQGESTENVIKAGEKLAELGESTNKLEQETLANRKELIKQTQKSNDEISKSFTELQNLNSEYEDGKLTYDEYYSASTKLEEQMKKQVAEQRKLALAVSSTSENTGQASNSLDGYTGAVNKAQIKVNKLVSEMRSQEKALLNEIEGTTVYNKQLALLNLTRSKAIDAQRELRNLQDLENKTVSELNVSYRQLSKEMEILEERYRRNELTAGAYANQKAILAEKLAIVKGYLGDNVQLLDKTNKAYRNAAGGVDAYNKALEKNTSILDANLEKHRKRIEALKAERDEQIKNQSLSFAQADYSGFDIDDIYEEEQRLQALIRLNNKAGFVSRPVAELATTQLREELDRLQRLRAEIAAESGKTDKRFSGETQNEKNIRHNEAVRLQLEEHEQQLEERRESRLAREEKLTEQNSTNSEVMSQSVARLADIQWKPSIFNIQLPTGIVPIEVANDESRDNLLNLLNIQNQGKK